MTLVGLWAIVNMLWAGNQINLVAMGIFIGPGLYALRPGLRICGLVFLWILVPLSGIGFLAGIFHWLGNMSWNFFFSTGMIGLWFTLFAWMLWVLMRPDVRGLFIRTQNNTEI